MPFTLQNQEQETKLKDENSIAHSIHSEEAIALMVSENADVGDHSETNKIQSKDEENHDKQSGNIGFSDRKEADQGDSDGEDEGGDTEGVGVDEDPEGVPTDTGWAWVITACE